MSFLCLEVRLAKTALLQTWRYYTILEKLLTFIIRNPLMLAELLTLLPIPKPDHVAVQIAKIAGELRALQRILTEHPDVSVDNPLVQMCLSPETREYIIANREVIGFD
jgi:hypothetical protein